MNNQKVLIAGYIGMFFFGVAFIVMGAVLPSLSEAHNLSEAASASVVSLLPIGVMIASLLFGPIIDRFGYKQLMIIATLIEVIGIEMLAFMDSLELIRVAVFLIGLGGGMLNGATNALVADASEDKSKASNLSLLGFFYCVGAFIIPFLMASLSKTFDYVHILSVTGIILFLSAVYYAVIKFPSAKFKQGIPLKKIFSMAKEPTLILFSFVLFFQSGIEGLSNNWSPKFFEGTYGFATNQAQYALSFLVVGMGIGRLLLSFLLRKFKKDRVLEICMCLALAGSLILMFNNDGNMAFAITGTILLGMGFASTFPVVLAHISDLYKEMSGTAFSFALVIGLIGNSLLNLLIGAVGVKYLPLILIISVLVLFIFYTFAVKSKNKQLQ